MILTELINCSQSSPGGSIENFSFNIKPLYKCLKNEGNLAWEYNPLRNYRLNSDKVATNSLDQVLDDSGNTIYSSLTRSELTSISYKNLSYYGALSNTRASTTNQAMELTDFTSTSTKARREVKMQLLNLTRKITKLLSQLEEDDSK